MQPWIRTSIFTLSVFYQHAWRAAVNKTVVEEELPDIETAKLAAVALAKEKLVSLRFEVTQLELNQTTRLPSKSLESRLNA